LSPKLRDRQERKPQNTRAEIQEQKLPWSQAWVAHTCNPSYSGGRDQEKRSLKPVQVNNSRDPISKKSFIKKRAAGVVQDVSPEFKPQYRKKERKEMSLVTNAGVEKYLGLLFFFRLLFCFVFGRLFCY
jgi:hypothetical protein